MRHMITIISSVLTTALGSAASDHARAQSFNLDAGKELGLPDASYGAAADQPGQWQELAFNAETTVALIDIDGAATAATISSPLPFGPAFTEGNGPSGDDEKLLGDYLDLHSTPATLEIAGLAPGDYVIYTYAWAPDDSRYATVVSVNDDSQQIGGAWTGALEEGVTHARHAVTVRAGDVVGVYTFGLTKGTLNGMQIVAVPPAVVEPEPEPEPAVEASPEPGPEPEPGAEVAAEPDVQTREDAGCGAGPTGGVIALAALALLARRRRSVG